MSDVQKWSSTAANNNDASPDGWPENMAYSAVNNAARENMAAIASWYKDLNGTLTTGGTSTAYTLAPNRTFSAYEDGMEFVFKVDEVNTGAVTLNVSSLGAKSVVDIEGNALAAGDFVANRYYRVVYQTSQFYAFFLNKHIRTDAIQAYSKQHYFTEATLTDGTNISWDLDTEAEAVVTLSANRILDNPTNQQAGGWYHLRVVQDGTGTRTLSYGTAYNFGDEGAPALSTAAASEDVMSFRSNGTAMQYMGVATGVDA